MNIGQSIRTLPTVKPKLYAGKVGTIAASNEDEFGVLINGKIVWFVEKEIEEHGESARNGQTTRDSGNNEYTGEETRQSRVASAKPPIQKPRPPGLSRGVGATETMATVLSESGPVPGPPQRLVTNPSRAVPGSERPSEPRPPLAAPRGAGDLSGFKPGERGPGGGVVAKCVECGVLWERPKQRGRPALKCPTCR